LENGYIRVVEDEDWFLLFILFCFIKNENIILNKKVK
jgi:hypothetical protein